MTTYHYNFTAASRTSSIVGTVSVVAGVASLFTGGLSTLFAGIGVIAGVAASSTDLMSAFAGARAGQPTSKRRLFTTLGNTVLSLATLGVSAKAEGLITHIATGVGAAGAVYGLEQQISNVATVKKS